MPCAEILPIFPPSLFVFVTVQLTGTVAPVEAVAVQANWLPEETLDAATLVPGSTQVTAVIAVAATMVRLAVAVKVDCAWEVAVMVTTLLVGTVAGAVYNPPVEIEPVPVPPTDKFTRVLLRFNTVAVHCEVESTVTSTGLQETVIVGVVVVELELLPQEL